MKPTFVITADKRYYPQVRYTDTLQEAQRIAAELVVDLRAYAAEDTRVCIALVVANETIPATD